MIRRLPLAAVLWVCASLVLLSPVSAGTRKAKPHPVAPVAEGSPAAPAAEAASGTAHLRVWKVSDTKEGAALQIRLLSAGEPGAKEIEISTSAERYQFTGYNDVPAGAGVIEISAAYHPPSRLGVNLAKNQNCTLLVRVQGGSVATELLDDALPPGNEAPAFSVFNLMFGGKGEVQINLGDALTAHLSASGGTLRARGVKAAFYQIVVSGTDGDGQSLRWNTETDLRKVRRATLIICPDAYGRIRPRLIEDGSPNDTASVDKTSGGPNG